MTATHRVKRASSNWRAEEPERGHMTARPRPTARRIGLGHELKTMRRKLGMTLAQAAEDLPFDATTLQRVETGHRSFRQASYLRALLERYGVTDEVEVERLLALQREGSSREWWTGQASSLRSGSDRFLGAEAAAREIRGFHPVAVPGLLQTLAYAAALHALHNPVDAYPPGHTEYSIKTRMKRQEAFLRDVDPVRLWIVLYEPALRYRLAEPGVMREQYEHIADLAARDNVTIQVMPSDIQGYVAFQDIHIMILDHGLPTTVMVDTAWLTVAVTDKPKEVERISRMFDVLAANALPPGETPRIMGQLAREIAP
ncbi:MULTISPECIES: helix-turn-helix domain-containing protein [Streptomyces]|uniref:Helix-turn-helix transcriptional regulator n=1 Tax=Streptomyces evansiae TaxID=3075535 RepID=A0ABU2R334_9ACTN|nr:MULTISPECIES: helix-turn-helix transcriptional regulator [unclassified Streptomyces]MDT0411118.1 helix-turn-helix transcriptional regulator [Streptomyces sp. DSM 41979]